MSDIIAWQPSADIFVLKQRAKIIGQIRGFFIERGYWEVETPIMAQYGISDVYLANISARFRQQTFYLQTSPEYHMKRLLAAGSGPIFQLSRVFRDDELGRWHNPEFSLLEWYQLDIDHHQLLDEVDALIQSILKTSPCIRKTYSSVFQDLCGIDPFNTNLSDLKACLKKYQLGDVLAADETEIDQYLFLLMSQVIEPALAKLDAPVAVIGFPPSQAALAQIEQGIASRFEVYYRGVELANGFHELCDAQLQQQRFEQDNQLRQSQNKPLAIIDPYFLAALQAGLPSCSGVALGIDRLIALALNQSSLSAVLAFDVKRA